MEVKAEYLAIFSEEAGDQLREWFAGFHCLFHR